MAKKETKQAAKVAAKKPEPKKAAKAKKPEPPKIKTVALVAEIFPTAEAKNLRKRELVAAGQKDRIWFSIPARRNGLVEYPLFLLPEV